MSPSYIFQLGVCRSRQPLTFFFGDNGRISERPWVRGLVSRPETTTVFFLAFVSLISFHVLRVEIRIHWVFCLFFLLNESSKRKFSLELRRRALPCIMARALLSSCLVDIEVLTGNQVASCYLKNSRVASYPTRRP